MSLKKFEIKNANVIAILEDFRYTYRELYNPEETNECMFPRYVDKADYYTGPEFLKVILDQGEEHLGAAEVSVCYPIKPHHYNGTHPDEYQKTWSNLDATLKEELGLSSSALSTLYPPNGFIGWHNNANASAYNLIFSWSENGDGWFRYIDPVSGEEITVQDEKGWNLKAGHFGQYGSGDVVYHCARTNCYRMTLSYVLGHNQDYWQDCIDYITNP